MINIGIIGTGAIGSAIATKLADGAIPGARLVAIAGRPQSHERIASQAWRWQCQVTEPHLLATTGANLIIEAAGPEIAKAHAVPLLKAGCDFIIMSTGALADLGFVSDLKNAATATGRRVYLPSGSIAGIDGILSAMESGDVDVRVTTRKRPEALAGAPFFERTGLNVLTIHTATTIFDGDAREAVSGFPANLNVALTLASAVGSFDHVQVRIVADPETKYTVHQIEVAAKSGSILVEMTNRPSESNPKSSWLAALSAIATIRRLASPLRFG